MASTSVSDECRFKEGEIVLCYEPDPKKTRLLYDSKVMKISFLEDYQGRKYCNYLIHFQGWKQSYDQFVSDHLLLKHTVKNCILQKRLAEKAQLSTVGNTYKKQSKKIKNLVTKPISEKRINEDPVREKRKKQRQTKRAIQDAAFFANRRKVYAALLKYQQEQQEKNKKMVDELKKKYNITVN